MPVPFFVLAQLISHKSLTEKQVRLYEQRT